VTIAHKCVHEYGANYRSVDAGLVVGQTYWLKNRNNALQAEGTITTADLPVGTDFRTYMGDPSLIDSFGQRDVNSEDIKATEGVFGFVRDAGGAVDETMVKNLVVQDGKILDNLLPIFSVHETVAVHLTCTPNDAALANVMDFRLEEYWAFQFRSGDTWREAEPPEVTSAQARKATDAMRKIPSSRKNTNHVSTTIKDIEKAVNSPSVGSIADVTEDFLSMFALF